MTMQNHCFSSERDLWAIAESTPSFLTQPPSCGVFTFHMDAIRTGRPRTCSDRMEWDLSEHETTASHLS